MLDAVVASIRSRLGLVGAIPSANPPVGVAIRFRVAVFAPNAPAAESPRATKAAATKATAHNSAAALRPRVSSRTAASLKAAARRG